MKQQVVKILKNWEKTSERAPYKAYVETEDTTRGVYTANLVYWGKTVTPLVPGQEWLCNIDRMTEDQFGKQLVLKHKENENGPQMQLIDDIYDDVDDIQDTSDSRNLGFDAKFDTIEVKENEQIREIKTGLEIYREELPQTHLPSFSEIEMQVKRYEFVKKSLINSSDFITVGNRSFMKKSGFRKFINAFGLSVELRRKIELRDDDGQISFEVYVRVHAPSGQYIDGVAICEQFEKGNRRARHATYATAYTRAVNRAVSDLVAFGEVSAEEMI